MAHFIVGYNLYNSHHISHTAHTASSSTSPQTVELVLFPSAATEV